MKRLLVMNKLMLCKNCGGRLRLVEAGDKLQIYCDICGEPELIGKTSQYLPKYKLIRGGI